MTRYDEGVIQMTYMCVTPSYFLSFGEIVRKSEFTASTFSQRAVASIPFNTENRFLSRSNANTYGYYQFSVHCIQCP